MDVKTIDDTGRRLVAQPLQGRAEQAGAAVARVEEDMLGLQPPAIGRDPLAQAIRSRKLAIWLAMVPLYVCWSLDTL